ncbi:MAG: hypothetical protein F4103_17315 [Boseongicola sp. SB0673_bin_14]|nr:hypothetical protein [Boseongicola sp.]MXW84765.1 hypothetical protein [Boseongicola sp. SB0667_bin_21]MYI70418.1 hypothetical protein [Boseongicola sp. SB0673_bin_14]
MSLFRSPRVATLAAWRDEHRVLPRTLARPHRKQPAERHACSVRAMARIAGVILLLFKNDFARTDIA